MFLDGQQVSGPHVVDGKNAQQGDYKEPSTPFSRLRPDADISK